MAVYQFDPLRDPRWDALVQRHPNASVFHTPGWLQALQRTYGYEPVVFTTAASGEELKNGLVFCRIQSWLTGLRMVSLPFSDHCEALVDNAEDLKIILSFLESRSRSEKWKYIELRPLLSQPFDGEARVDMGKSEEFSFHKLNLRPGLDELFRSFHKSCVQRKIRKAENEELTCEEGRSEAILMKFYRLLLLTRRRHQLPPQPLGWFRNLIDCLGENLNIRVASKDGQPIASILTLVFRDSLVYKYGCSDDKFHSLGGMILLFWRTIQEGKRLGASELDFGRSEPENSGLIEFKGHWGASQSRLEYFRYPVSGSEAGSEVASMQLAKRVFGHMPNCLLTTAGRLLYRHMG